MEVVHKLVEVELKGEIVHVTILRLFMVEHLVMVRLLTPEIAIQIHVQVIYFTAKKGKIKENYFENLCPHHTFSYSQFQLQPSFQPR